MIVNKPPMGWNTWNTFMEDIDEEKVKASADALAASGLDKAGYNYLVIDDGWSEKRRDSNGRLVPDKKRFPNGMKSLSDYVHSKGLKFGMYSDVGNWTCALYPGSYQFEYIDAQTFAEWGVDFLKYDYGNKPMGTHGKLLYRRMGAALATCGRDILFSACSWGTDETHEWIKTTGAHMWRSTHDLFNSWESLNDIARSQVALQPYNGQGCFNDMDMLIVGLHDTKLPGDGCNDTEYKTHFALWCVLGSPLMIGGDIRDMKKEHIELLSNKELIKIDQDEAYRQAFLASYGPDVPVWVRMLSNGDYAIGLFNLTDEEGRAQFCLPDLGIDRSTGKTLQLKNVFTGEEKTVYNGIYAEFLKLHDCTVFRAKIVPESF